MRRIWEYYKTGRATREKKKQQHDTELDNRTETDKSGMTEDPDILIFEKQDELLHPGAET